VWSDTTHIHGKTAVNAQYSGLKTLFVETLRVPQLDLKMVFEQLLEARSLRLPVPEVKELLKTLSSFLRTETRPPSPNRLLNARVFPVREPVTSNVVLHTSTSQFAVVDREGPPSRFTAMVKVLDFTLQEIRQLKPLLTWTGLESRYLSQCVKEVSRLGDGLQRPISQPHRDLRRKAYPLLRYAQLLICISSYLIRIGSLRPSIARGMQLTVLGSMISFAQQSQLSAEGYCQVYH